MSALHTLGPWEAREDAHGRGLIYAAGKWLATTWRANGDGNDAPYLPSEANARLIAAAPELLEALQNLLTYPLGTFQVEAAKAAIAKATGQ